MKKTVKKVVVFLQNPWSPVWAGKEWPRESWLQALQKSRSGQRLRVMERHLKKDIEVWYDNTSLVVGKTADSIFPPNLVHIENVIQEQRPDLVVACGKQAENALLGIFPRSLLIVPHPAHRLVTNSLYELAATWINYGLLGALALRQREGYVQHEVPSHEGYSTEWADTIQKTLEKWGGWSASA